MVPRLVHAIGPPRQVQGAKHVVAAARNPATAAQLAALGIAANGTTPEELVAQTGREQAQSGDAIKAAQLQPQKRRTQLPGMTPFGSEKQ